MTTQPPRRTRGETRSATVREHHTANAHRTSARESRASAPAERVARVVELFVVNPGRRFNLSQIVDELQLSISTVHSILTTLVARRWLVRRAGDKTYALGPRLAAAASASRAATVGLREIETAVDRMSVELGVVCSASIVDGDEVVILAQAAPPGAADPAVRVGQRVPFGAPFGVSFVAWSGADQIDAWLNNSPLGVSATERALYRRVFEGIRERGYGVERLDSSRTKLHDALIEYQHETMSRALVAHIRDFLPLFTMREYLPEELIEHDPLDVAVVHAPIRDENGVCVFNLSAQILRTVSRAELELIGRVIADAAAATAHEIAG
jgi:DNA-binding IclR family transcriptional regulator